MKKYQSNLGVFTLLYCAVCLVNANEKKTHDLALAKNIIEQAIIKFEQTDKKQWSYTVSRYEDEEGDVSSSIEAYSPKLIPKWTLKEINGELPTQKQKNRFVKKKEKQKESKKDEGNISLSFRELINQESLFLISSDDKEIMMGFDVVWQQLGDDAIGKLQGKLSYQKDKQFIDNVSIWNNTEFSPMFSAKITDLNVNFQFVEINGAVLAKQNEMKMKGSFAYFTEINETSLDSYSNYLNHQD